MLRGGRTAEWLAAGDTTFVSFSFLNDGLSDATATFTIDLELDGSLVAAWTRGRGPGHRHLCPGRGPPPGDRSGPAHADRARGFRRDTVPESDETDNVFSRTLTWVAGEPVLRLTPTSVTRTIIPDTAMVAGLVADPPVRREVHLPLVSPRLAVNLDKAAPDRMLRVVVVPAERLDPAAMAAALKDADRTTRRRAVLDAARTMADRHRRQIASLVDSLVGQGLARPARTLWLSQVSIIETTAAGVAALADHPAVGRLWLDDLKSRTFGGPAPGTGSVPPAAVSAADKAMAWHLTAIGADQAWAAGYDGEGILVGHIDTGIAYDHPDLAGHLWDGGPSYPNHGYDALDPDNDPYDGDLDWYHGTHTSGLIVGDGIAGTTCGGAPGAVLMALRAVPGYFADLVEAQQFGLDHGAMIFSMSAGWCNPPDDVRAANRYNGELFLSIDLPVIAAAGNGDNYGGHLPLPTDIASPGDCPNPWYAPGGGNGAVITVGAVRSNLTVTATSSIGPTAWNIDNPYGETSYRDYVYPPGLMKPDVAAPGESITSCSGDYGYVTYSGTSMACPLVTSAACILMQAVPGLLPSRLAEILETSAVDITASPASAGRDPYTGAGMIDIPGALALAPSGEMQQVWVHNDGAMPLILGTVSEGASWLAVTAPGLAIAPGDSAAITLAFDPAALVPGLYTAVVTIPSNDSGSPHSLPVTLILGGGISGIGDGPPDWPSPGLAGHPNPFNPRTVLSFDLAAGSRVSLEIFDIRGRMVRRLIDESLASGQHSTVWDGLDSAGRPVPSGTYLARLQIPGITPVTGKLMLVR